MPQNRLAVICRACCYGRAHHQPIGEEKHSIQFLELKLHRFITMDSSSDIREQHGQQISITPLLRRLWPSPGKENVQPSEIAFAISHIFTDSLSPVQTGALLTALHFTGWDRRADVIARCASVMRDASAPVDIPALQSVTRRRSLNRGSYGGGLVR